MDNKKLTYSQAVSLRIQELMDSNGKTKYWVSMNSGVPHPTLKAIVDAKYKQVSANAIINICRAFNISLSEFFDSPYFYIEFLQTKE